jgi:hypothetical protein
MEQSLAQRTSTITRLPIIRLGIEPGIIRLEKQAPELLCSRHMPPDLCGQVGEVRRGVGTVQVQPELYARGGGVSREARVKRRHEGRAEGVDAALVISSG